MNDLSVKGVARRYLGRTVPFSVRADLMGGASGSLRSALESAAAVEFNAAFSECNRGAVQCYQQVWTHITVRAIFNADAGITDATVNNLLATWQQGIDTIWSDVWQCSRAGELACPLTFELQEVTSNQHYTVRIRSGGAAGQTSSVGPNRTALFDTLDTGAVIAHEYGHMLGHPDEYAVAGCTTQANVNTSTVMDNNSANVPQRLVQQFADELGSNLSTP